VTVSTPELDPVEWRSAQERDADTIRLLTRPTIKLEPTPAISQKNKEAVGVAATPGPAARDALVDASPKGVRQAIQAAVGPETKVSESVRATVVAASHFIKQLEEKAVFAHQQKARPQPDRALPDVSKKVCCCLAWIGGAVFTSILAPLIVELIKLRMGLGQTQADSPKSSTRSSVPEK
jgi:hypothetical protein